MLPWVFIFWTFMFVRDLLILSVCLLPSLVHGEWYTHDDSAMGTVIRIEIWQESKEQADKLFTESMAELNRIDALMSPYKEQSELSLINQNAADGPVSVGMELYNLIARSLYFSNLSDGAFDITFASVGFLYDYRKGMRPKGKQLEDAVSLVNYKWLLLNPDHHSIEFKKKGMKIDLGGIAKGYAVDRVYQILVAKGVKHGVITAGGDNRLIGDRRGRPWVLGIKHPRGEGYVLRLPLSELAISTSGDYERYFDEGEMRYHHIIDPQKGDSARALVSATIIANDATTSDALSTTVFVLGPEKGIGLVNKLDGISAIVIDNHGKVFYSNDLQPD